MSLDQLIQNCTKGDRKSQEQLYRKYSGVLYGICLKYSNNKTEAEDTLHDSFMTIYEKIGQYKSKGSFEGWMKRITVNTALQKFRKEEHLKVVDENLEDGVSVDVVENDVCLQTLLGYIRELPNKYRTTFNLYVLDGHTHKEISELLGTSEGTSKSNLARARVLLKEKIEKKVSPTLIGLIIMVCNAL